MAKQKRTISGPGASDFLASEGGEDRPGTSPTKGMGSLREESDLTNPRNLVPRLGPDTEAEPGERPSGADADSDVERTGSQTGTIGGGGPEAHKAGKK
jgi:hypothetical protein